MFHAEDMTRISSSNFNSGTWMLFTIHCLYWPVPGIEIRAYISADI